MSDIECRSEGTLSKTRDFSALLSARGFEKKEEMHSSCQFRHVSKIAKIDFSRVSLSLGSVCLPSSTGCEKL